MTTERPGIRWWAAAIAGVATLSWATSSAAHHAVLRFNLEEMTVTADRIFVGRCVGVEATKEDMAQGVMPVTRYTFEVERAVKGELPARFTFRQLGHPAPTKSAKGGQVTMHGQPVTPSTFLHGLSDYKVGDRLLLFLIPDYMGGKVTYPVGLDQGAFFLSKSATGEELARNNLNNLGLLSAPYNGTKLSAAGAKVIRPDQEEPVAARAGLATEVQSLSGRRGAWPLASLLALTAEVNEAHGGPKGAVRQ
jgi:hypothetical protein